MNLILVGKSCSGKTEISKYLTENFRYDKVISTTTRSPRKDEVDGIDYNFLNKKDFLSKYERGELFCVGEYNGNFYGLDIDDIRDVDNKVFILEPNGALELYEFLENSIMLYVNADDGIIFGRQLRRGDNEEEISGRKLYDMITFDGFSDICDVIEIDNNGDIPDTVREILEVVSIFGG